MSMALPFAARPVPADQTPGPLAGRADGTATAAGALTLALVAFLYYGAYLRAGYNYADDGHYAQVAYEFLLGTDPHAVRFGYGLLWHQAGAWLFALTGPSYAVVRGLFFTLAGVTAVLVFLTARRLAVPAAPAFAAALTAVLAPAYPATVFYGVCTLINVFAQVRAARRGAALGAGDLVLPALALSATFQIRADFGYVLGVPLLGLIAWAAVSAERGARRRRFVVLLGAAAAVVIGGHLPLAAVAAYGGYLDLIAAEYLRYPLAVLKILLHMLRGAEAGAAGSAGTLLQRPPLSALRSGPPFQAGLALLTYACPLLIAAFALSAGAAFRWGPADGRARRLAEDGIVLTGALASFPHYFLYRPDLPHIANFMPGFLVLAAALAARLWRGIRRPWLGKAVPAALAAVLAVPGIYLWLGLSGPGTGSIVLAEGRTLPFAAANGVDVRLAADEHALLSALREVVERNSQPGDRIVCLPFCPGIAFMTGRRLLLREHYVDDSFLVTDPGWIERTIALTDRERPPVVVTFDWALNGTELSRVRTWAAPYYAFLDGVAREKLDVLGATVHLLPRAPLPSQPAGTP